MKGFERHFEPSPPSQPAAVHYSKVAERCFKEAFYFADRASGEEDKSLLLAGLSRKLLSKAHTSKSGVARACQRHSKFIGRPHTAFRKAQTGERISESPLGFERPCGEDG
eukprot:TRINITY_DN167_c0_g1_i1.p3 TRINITY_DN167_c0_g1~~TRINITY_DN167_c0_g1_i1.p3  ORF type:complete len:110 (+),score=3.84 TRINITY_DN167_c0_g1_i1:1526-1855(+)